MDVTETNMVYLIYIIMKNFNTHSTIIVLLMIYQVYLNILKLITIHYASSIVDKLGRPIVNNRLNKANKWSYVESLVEVYYYKIYS
jgi:hypothetical protein